MDVAVEKASDIPREPILSLIKGNRGGFSVSILKRNVFSIPL